eukprot:TRINITY_DN54028_c0_g1_i1.p1 TRINITY_DN54028_c0_g1~~TRINITY_DN54028_c0_g1_i1.p1  ORF type:complete len:557 (-),score=56.18 TRINITY_DN54028_c0_g1_i1:226-1896(-)
MAAPMNIPTCCICLEEFNRDINPPVSCVPCGHDVCRPCLDQCAITRGLRRLCPLCRTPITSQMPNRSLMDMIEASGVQAPAPGSEQDSDSMDVDQTSHVAEPSRHDESRVGSNLFSGHVRARAIPDSLAQRRANEMIHDDTDCVFCVIDNSGSMRSIDGKIFEADATGRLRKRGHGSVTRWQEAGHKCLQVADYNYRRGVPAVYYLLNPQSVGRWIRDIDFIEIEGCAGARVGEEQRNDVAGNAAVRREDGELDTALAKLRKMLDPSNVRGATPLEQITRHLRQQITGRNSDSNRICYVLFTDGEPSNKRAFEQELRHLAQDTRCLDRGRGGTLREGVANSLKSLFLTINLCTDQDEVISYYNDLDQKLGNELSGMDVLDDLEAEQREVISAGNTFMTYCAELHVCRMSGCHSVLGDLLDEHALGMFHTVKLVKEVLRLDALQSYDSTLWLEDSDAYLELIASHNVDVFDFYSRRMKPLIHLKKVKDKIWWYKLSQEPYPGSKLYRSCRDYLADSGWGIVVSWLKYPLLLFFCFLLLRTAIVQRMLLALLKDQGEL